MTLYRKVLEIDTQKEFEIKNISRDISDIIKESPIKNGFVNVFSTHTTLAVTLNEYEKLLLLDIEEILNEIAPLNKEYHHDQLHLRENLPPNEPKNAHSHLRSLFTTLNPTIPVSNYKMELGIYQSIIAIETSGPRHRKLVVSVYSV